MLVVRGLIDRQTVAARAVQSFRMECLDKELIAALLVKQIFNRHKQHTKWNAHRARFVKAVHQADTAVLPLLRLRLAGALHLEGRMSRLSLPGNMRPRALGVRSFAAPSALLRLTAGSISQGRAFKVISRAFFHSAAAPLLRASRLEVPFGGSSVSSDPGRPS